MKKEFKFTRWWTRSLIMETGKSELGYIRHCNEQQLKMKSRTNNKKEFRCTRWWNWIMETGKFQLGFMRHCNEHWQQSETKSQGNNKKEFKCTFNVTRSNIINRISPFWFNATTRNQRWRGCRVLSLRFGLGSGSNLQTKQQSEMISCLLVNLNAPFVVPRTTDNDKNLKYWTNKKEHLQRHVCTNVHFEVNPSPLLNCRSRQYHDLLREHDLCHWIGV